ncbi:MAG: GIY-YIG nuclease family protein [Candidatus Bathyarchaeia archaeon]|nr:GIY-YIG nuclease family protein [Candidatus Bathyarchaeota archaeon]
MATLKGIYILAVLVSRDETVKVGSLGTVTFAKGLYAYVGSAQNGLEKRLRRHLRKALKRKFWHIDYFLAVNSVNVVKVFFKEAEKPEECATAHVLAQFGLPVMGFGCSDCNCKSHLFHFSSIDLLETTCLKLGFAPVYLSCQ